MDDRTVATRKFARRIVAECAPGELTVFDETVDELLEDLPTLLAGDAGPEKPADFGELVLYPLYKLALILADHLIAVLPGAVAEVALAKGLEEAIKKARKPRRARRKPADTPEELLSIHVSRTGGPHPATVVHAVIGEALYPTTEKCAIALLDYVARFSADSGHADATANAAADANTTADAGVSAGADGEPARTA